MITTRDIFVKLGIGRPKLQNLTTKNVDASPKITKPKGAPKKSHFITTADVDNEEDRVERRKRLEIIAERKKVSTKKVKFVEPSKELLAEMETARKKKPWKEMTDDEKKVAYKERAQRSAATKAAKKKKKEK